jgi:general secretion pathway protein K
MTGKVAPVQSAQRGFVIVAVLWILVALSSLAVIFTLYLSVSAQALALSDGAVQGEALTSASVELTAYQLLLTSDEERPSHGSFHFRMDDANVRVSFASETARIDLNYASKDMLAALLTVLGANKDAAKEDAERVVGWRTSPIDGTPNDEEALYATAGLPYAPRQSLFTHANELALVVGLPPALVERALPFVTVFNGSSAIDDSIAAPEVIAAMRASSPDANKDAFGDSSLSLDSQPASANASAPPANAAQAAKSPCYRIETTIVFSTGRRTSSEVVISLGDKTEPYHVLSWQDDVEPPRPAAPVRRRS